MFMWTAYLKRQCIRFFPRSADASEILNENQELKENQRLKENQKSKESQRLKEYQRFSFNIARKCIFLQIMTKFYRGSEIMTY